MASYPSPERLLVRSSQVPDGERIKAAHHSITPSSQTNRRRFLFTDTSCPVIFRLPALPVPPTLTCSSNSPPIFLLHLTQTSVSGMTSSRSGGISAPQILQ